MENGDRSLDSEEGRTHLAATVDEGLEYLSSIIGLEGNLATDIEEPIVILKKDT